MTKKVVINLLQISLSIFLAILTLSFAFVCISALWDKNDVIGAYIVFFVFLISVMKNYFYVFSIGTVLLAFSNWELIRKFRLIEFSGFLLFLAVVLLWGISLGYYNVKANTLSVFGKKSWKDEVQATQFIGANNMLSEAICADLEKGWPPNVIGLDEAIAHIDGISKDSGFRLAKGYSYIERGYITYYFKPENRDGLEAAKEKAANAFHINSIGPTFYWLNRKWYEEHYKGVRLPKYKHIDVDDKFIRVKFETLFPHLKDYSTKRILRVPPEHILKIAEAEGFEFVKSERLDPISYTYSVPVPHFKFLGGFYNITFSLWGAKGEGTEYKYVELNKISCGWPKYGLKTWDTGMPPSRSQVYPLEPEEVPYCPEYRSWFYCQREVKKTRICKTKYAKGTPAPICSPEADIAFPEEEY